MLANGNEMGIKINHFNQADNGEHWESAVMLKRSAKVQPKGIVVLIPAYNEERFIGSIVLKARPFAEKILVVDDGSTDRTAELAEAAGAIVIRQQFNAGKGTALNVGFCKVREWDPHVLVVLDADGQHLPEEIETVITPILQNKADIVVGSRYLEPKSQVPRHRIWGHHVFNFLTNHASGVSVTDSQSGFRAFSNQALEAVSFQSSGFSVESEMQFLAREHELRLMEVPITIRYEDPPKRSVIGQGVEVLNGMLHLAGEYRPLLFFTVLGLLNFSIGVGSGLWAINVYQENQALAIASGLASMLLLIIGTLALFTGVLLHSVRILLLKLVRPQRR
jgi:glycosyltransferase involved in cell wall biosynthesis